MKLSRDFYQNSALNVARRLIGVTLVRITPDRTRLSGKIVETEAYLGLGDDAAHANKGKTPRTEVLFGEGGHAYVYLIYGIHCCLNIAVDRPGVPGCVLIRALEPVDGIARMQKNRHTQNIRQLCSGPGKLCQALEVTLSDYGTDLCSDTFFAEGKQVPDTQILTTPRINIAYATETKEKPWRFLWKNNPYISVN